MIWELFIPGAIFIILFFVFLWVTSVEPISEIPKTEWELLGESIEEAKVEIGKVFIPIIEYFIDELIKII